MSLPATKKLYDDTPYERSFQAHLLSCQREDRYPEAPYALILDQTLFFPEEGGQEADVGILHLMQESIPHSDSMREDAAILVSVRVLYVKHQGEHIIHYCEHPLPTGAFLEGVIDWEHRFDQMQNHTGEHIFSGLVHANLGYENVGFHLSQRTCSMDYDGPLNAEQIADLEAEANQVIFETRPIRTYYPNPDSLLSLPYRSKKELSGDIRLVDITGCDLCACCAPHVASTGEVGLLKVLRAVNYKGGIRLYIACGSRALAAFSSLQSTTDACSRLLSASQEELPSSIEKKLTELSQLKTALHESSAKLLSLQIASLAQSSRHALLFCQGLDPIRQRYGVNEMTQQHEGYCAIFDGDDASGYRYIVGSANMDARQLNQNLKEHFGARGGGSSAMCQGSLLASRQQIESLLRELL